MQLNDIDYKVLEFIGTFEKVSLDEVLKKFPENEYSTERRIFNLQKETIDSGYIIELIGEKTKNELGETVYFPSGEYSITALGRKELQDHKLTTSKLRRRDFILFIIPTIISTFALLKSYKTEIIWLLQQLLQSPKQSLVCIARVLSFLFQLF